MQRFSEFLKKQSSLSMTTLGVALIFLFGVVDHLARPRVSFTLFYLLVVALVSWTAGKRAGVFVALLSALALTLGEHMDHRNSPRVWILYWNTGVRVGVFLFTALTVSRIRGLTDALERKVEQRTGELTKANRDLLQSKRELEHQTELLTAICNSIGDGVVVAAPDGKFLFFSPGAEEIVGMGKTDLPPAQWPRAYGLFSPDTVTPFPHEELPLVLALRGQATENVEVFLRNASVPDGRFLLACGRPLRGKTGEHRGGVVAVRDITDRKRAEQALVESHHLLQAVIEGTTDSVFVTDLEGRYLLGNATVAEGIGKPLHQIIGRRKEELFEPETARLLTEHDRRVLKRGRTETVEMVLELQGAPRVFSVTKGVYRDHRGEVAGLFGISREVTARKRQERQVTMQHAITRLLAEAPSLTAAAPGLLQAIVEGLDWETGLIWQLDRATNLLRCLESWHKPEAHTAAFETASRQMTYALGQGLPGGVWSTGEPAWIVDVIKDPKFRRTESAAEAGLRGALAVPILLGNEVLGVLEFFSRKPRQPDRELLETLGVVGSQVGQFVARKLAEEVLQTQARVLESMVEGVLVCDDTGMIFFTNLMLDDMFGYARGELIGRHVTVLNNYPPEENARVVAQVMEQVRTHGCWVGEFRNRRKDGGQFTSEARISALQTGDRKYFICVQQDVTERKRLERHIIEISDREQARIGKNLHDGLCQRMVSIGLACNSLASRLAAGSSPEAQSAAQVATLVDEALTECRSVARGLYPVKLEAEGLTSALTELASAISARFDIACALECPEPVLVHDNAVATHLYRIALEAGTNAVRHGQVTQIIIGLATSNGRTRLTITDDGIGIGADWKNRQGLGLHILHYRARMIGGALEISDAPAGGTIISCSAPQKVIG